jgi:arylsulfatase A-like enzyme
MMTFRTVALRRAVPWALGLSLLGLSVAWLRSRGQPEVPTPPVPPVEVPDVLAADPPRFLASPSGLGQDAPFDGARRARAWAGGELRNALLVAPTARFTVKALVPPRTWLRFGAAVMRPSGDPPRGGIHFSVHVRDARDRRRPLFSRFLDPSYDGGTLGWSDAHVSLERFAGQTVTFEFETRAEEPGPPAPGAPEYAAWSDPRLETAAFRDRPNVVLISLDTLRADHLGCYGYSRRDTSPAIDGMAAEGVRFAAAYAQAPWTTPSHASMLTGLYPSRHGVNQVVQMVKAHLDSQAPLRVLPRSAPTLAARLRDAGYATAAFTGGATVSARLGFAQGFDLFREDFADVARADYGALLSWLRSRAPRARGPESSPFFLFVHTFEVHAPYTHAGFATLSPAEGEGLKALLRPPRIEADAFGAALARQGLARAEVTSALYDGDIRSADQFVGQLLQDLEILDLDGETLVVLTSDHGEEFGDHDPARVYNAHGDTLYEEMIHVPLIMRFKGRLPAGRVVRRPVRSIDILPTVLAVAGLAPPGDVDGRSLAGFWSGRPLADAPVLAEATNGPAELALLRRGGLKYMALADRPSGAESRLVSPGEQLYDLARDPGERRNLAGARPRAATLLRRELEAMLAAARRGRRPPTLATQPDPELREQLRSLGYIR